MYWFQFIAQQTSTEAEDIEILVVKEPHFATTDESFNPAIISNYIISKIHHSCKDDLQLLEPKETLAGLQANCTSSRGHLVRSSFRETKLI